MSASLESLGSAGKLMSIEAVIRDATGITTTVATAGTAVALVGTAFAAGKESSGGSLTWTPASGKVAVAKQSGVGRYLAIFSCGDAIGANSARPSAQIFAVEGGAAVAAKGNLAAKTEPATAARGNLGVCMAVVDLSAVGDTVEIRLDSTTSGNTVLIRDASLQLIKIA